MPGFSGINVFSNLFYNTYNIKVYAVCTLEFTNFYQVLLEMQMQMHVASGKERRTLRPVAKRSFLNVGNKQWFTELNIGLQPLYNPDIINYVILF